MQAAEKLKITASELCKLQIADGVIPVIILPVFMNSILSPLLICPSMFVILSFWLSRYSGNHDKEGLAQTMIFKNFTSLLDILPYCHIQYFVPLL